MSCRVQCYSHGCKRPVVSILTCSSCTAILRMEHGTLEGYRSRFWFCARCSANMECPHCKCRIAQDGMALVSSDSESSLSRPRDNSAKKNVAVGVSSNAHSKPTDKHSKGMKGCPQAPARRTGRVSCCDSSSAKERESSF